MTDAEKLEVIQKELKKLHELSLEAYSQSKKLGESNEDVAKRSQIYSFVAGCAGGCAQLCLDVINS